MKKMLLALLSLSAWCVVLGQSKEEGAAFHPSGTVKWNPESLFFGKVGLSGEYGLSSRNALTLGIGIPATHTTRTKINSKKRDVDMKTFSIMGGYRHYLGKKSLSGLYLEPYVKYVKNDASTVIDGDLNGKTVDFATTSKYSGTGVGAQLGAQFLIGNRVVLDLFFLGPEANISRHRAVMHDITSTAPWDPAQAADAQRQINDNIGDLPILGKKLHVVVDPQSKTVSSDYKGFLPGFRMGLSIGVKL